MARPWQFPLAALCLVALHNRAEGQVAWTGHKLLNACAPMAGAFPSRDCEVYIRGVVDRYHEMLASSCPHTETSFVDLVRGVTAYLDEHRAELDRRGSDLVLESLRQRYHCTDPCPATGRGDRRIRSADVRPCRCSTARTEAPRP